MRGRHRIIVIAAAGALALGCTGEDATPIPRGTGVTTPHRLEPTEQMQDLAEQQCLDDPSLAEGVVNAVDPADTDQILASVTVDCDEVRRSGGGR